VFRPAPWHARWDTGRSLLNRALGGDYPGTLGVRRGALQRTGGYDGDVLFENLELMRTVRAGGGREVNALDLFVTRRPPTTRHFLGQRVRQAYDDLALPLRLAAFLALGPMAAVLARRRPRATAAALLVGPVALAEAGRRRAGGRGAFGPADALMAPLWVMERAACAWLALGTLALRGGCPYAGAVIPRAASSPRRLRRRLAAQAAARGWAPETP
jgi:hypothetical protein